MNQVSSSEARQYRRKDTPSDYPVPPLAPGPLEAAKNDANNERRFDAFMERNDQRLEHNRGVGNARPATFMQLKLN